MLCVKAGVDRIGVGDELRRPGNVIALQNLQIDTVRAFLAAEPGVELFFIVGADNLPELVTWKDHATLLTLALFAVAGRPGHDLEKHLASFERSFGADATRGLRERIVPIEEDPVSATEIRERVRAGKPIDGLVPAAVRDYMTTHGLYRALSPGLDSRSTQGEKKR